MMIRKGDRFKHRLSGDIYHVVLVKPGSVILQTEGSENRLWFGAQGMQLFFEQWREEKTNEGNLPRRRDALA